MHVLRKRPLRIIACPASSDSSLFAGSRAISSWTKSKCQRGAFLVKCELLIMNDQYQVIWQGGVVCITQRGSMVYVLGVEWNGGPVHIACPGVKLNEIQRRHGGQREISSTATVHLAIIQAWFSLSSRVLLVSNLRRSNWKCTVKRFFKSTVMVLVQSRARGNCGQLTSIPKLIRRQVPGVYYCKYL